MLDQTSNHASRSSTDRIHSPGRSLRLTAIQQARRVLFALMCDMALSMKKGSSAGGTSHSRFPGTNSITRYPIVGVPECAVLGYTHGREASSQHIPGKFLICYVRGRLRLQTEQQLCGNQDRYTVSTYYESYIPPLSSLTLLAFLTTSVSLPSYKEQPL